MSGRRRFFFLLTCAAALALAGCGGNNVVVMVTPSSANVTEDLSQQFMATVTGTSNTAVTWSVEESNGGTITAGGLYTAPSATGTFHVVAASVAKPSASATATVTVTPPMPLAPVFTSTPPTFAQEDDLYSYTVAATDPLGGTVSFALTAGYGSLSGSNFTWTPTHAQSRTPDSFSILATTSEGGTATQSWMVTPYGTIDGTWIDTYVDAYNQQTSVPQDFSTIILAALIPNGSGGYTTISGTGTSSGAFTIPGVPAGNFFLQHGIQYDNIATSNPNLGSYYSGRPGIVSGSASVAVTMGGFPSSVTQICDTWWVPNLNENEFDHFCPGNLLTVNSGSIADTIPQYELMDSTQGDEGYFIASTTSANVGQTVSLSTAGYSSGPFPLTTMSGGTTDVSGTVAAGSPQSTDVDIQLSAFAALRGAANPGYTQVQTDFAVEPMLYGNLYGPIFFNEPSALAYQDLTGSSTDVDLGSVAFGEFDSGEPLYFTMLDQTQQTPSVSGALLIQIGQVYTGSGSGYSSSSPAAPVVGPVTSPMINSISFFNSQPDVSGAITVSWTPPSVGTPSFYLVQVNQVVQAGGVWAQAGTPGVFATTGTQVTLPAALFTAGDNYQFFITAYQQTGADLQNEVFPPTLDSAGAISPSGLITISTSAATKKAPAAGGARSYTAVVRRILRQQRSKSLP